jgi:CubicO group peptidase (beta-lactamase class C family)
LCRSLPIPLCVLAVFATSQLGLVPAARGSWEDTARRSQGSQRADAAGRYDFTELEGYLKRLTKLANHIAVIIRQRGEVIFELQVVGSDVRRPIPTTSCSKWLSAATLMVLRDEGRVDLDAPIARYLPHLGPRKGWITLRHLLSHTSGFPSRSRLRGLWQPDAHGRIGPVARYARLAAPPGTRFCYGSVSFQVAGQIAERVTGQRWNDIFQQRIAGPCGMSDTRFPPARPQLAGDGVSTAVDYSRFLEMFRSGGVAMNGTRVLSESSVEEMRRNHTRGLPFECVSRRFTRKEGYGLGVWGGAYDPETGESQFVSHFGASGFKGFIDYPRELTGVFAVKYRRGINRPLAKRRFIDALEMVLQVVPESRDE